MNSMILPEISRFDSGIEMLALVLDLLATIYGIFTVGMILACLSAIAWLCHSEARHTINMQRTVKRQEQVSEGPKLEESADLASV
jgi:hypothetical protein